MLLGPDDFAVDGELERSPARGNQSQTIDSVTMFAQDLGRQTDGLIGVVSDYAVFEFDFHDSSKKANARYGFSISYPAPVSDFFSSET